MARIELKTDTYQERRDLLPEQRDIFFSWKISDKPKKKNVNTLGKIVTIRKYFCV
jgi:hypothetical protein